MMDDLIKEAASIIRDYDPALAEAFISNPFRRIDLACAFSSGFVKSPEDDAPEFCNIILRVAYADRDARRLAAQY
jgi:hypothetical protein